MPILLANGCNTEGQQGITWQIRAHLLDERHCIVAARWAEAAHLIRQHLASNWLMLPAERRRERPDGARVLPTARARCRTTCEAIFTRGHMFRAVRENCEQSGALKRSSCGRRSSIITIRAPFLFRVRLRGLLRI